MSNIYIKSREIQFATPHPDNNQAQSAMLLFADIRGIEKLHLLNPQCILVSYDVRELTLNMLETVLIELGFHLDNNLLVKIKRALYSYTEDTERANLGITKTSKDFSSVFIEDYQRHPHGCRDERPKHWRQYR